MKSHLRIIVNGLLVFSFLSLVSCGNSTGSKKQTVSKGVISSGMMEGFPDSQKVTTGPSGNWEVAFFDDEFNNKTTWPYLHTINPLDVTCALVTAEGNKPTKSDVKNLFFRFSFTKKGKPRLSLIGSNLSYIFSTANDIPVNIVSGESRDSFTVYASTSSNNQNVININEKEDVVKIINCLLSDDEVTIQLKRKSSGLYNDPYDKIYSTVVGKEGIWQAYNDFINQQGEWEKTLNNN